MIAPRRTHLACFLLLMSAGTAFAQGHLGGAPRPGAGVAQVETAIPAIWGRPVANVPRD